MKGWKVKRNYKIVNIEARHILNLFRDEKVHERCIVQEMEDAELVGVVYNWQMDVFQFKFASEKFPEVGAGMVPEVVPVKVCIVQVPRIGICHQMLQDIRKKDNVARWKSECGVEYFIHKSTSPLKNNQKFCSYCGRTLLEAQMDSTENKNKEGRV